MVNWSIVDAFFFRKIATVRDHDHEDQQGEVDAYTWFTP